jgi:solute carrier family 35 protein E3
MGQGDLNNTSTKTGGDLGEAADRDQLLPQATATTKTAGAGAADVADASDAEAAAATMGGSTGGGALLNGAPPSQQAAWVKPLAYASLNIAAASGIVFANKMVFANFGFRFTVALTWVHTAVTWLGMRLMLRAGMFPAKILPPARVAPLAAAFVGYIVLCNLSLNLNTVGFYQIMKIAVAPTVLAMESVAYRRKPERRIAMSVGVVCLGIAIATLTDAQVTANAKGAMVGVAATLVTALYQLWVGTKQRELGASSMQLLHQYTPQATLMMGALVPLMEPVGWRHLVGGGGGADGGAFEGGGALSSHGDGTLLGYHYTPQAVAAILFSAGLGLLVSLSTFLVIGATSSLTYNVVGHLKTVIILTGGCLLFGDQMPGSKLAGLGVAMAGIVWYSHIKMGGGGGGSSSGGGGAVAAVGVGAAAALGAAAVAGSGGSRGELLADDGRRASEAMEAGQALLLSGNGIGADDDDDEVDGKTA